MKLITNEIEAEADKWNEPQNEIIKVKNIILLTLSLFYFIVFNSSWRN